MARVWLEFRGDEVQIEYRDYGWESDTNAHTIDWDFVGTVPEDLTEEEEEEILEQLCEISAGRSWDYD